MNDENKTEPNVYAVYDENGNLKGIKAAPTGPEARRKVKGGKTTKNFGPLSKIHQ